jgi:hypothetical protein
MIQKNVVNVALVHVLKKNAHVNVVLKMIQKNVVNVKFLFNNIKFNSCIPMFYIKINCTYK